MPPTFSFTPKSFTNACASAQVAQGPLITFYCEDDAERGQNYTAMSIHQYLLFANSKPQIPQLLDEIDEPERHNFEDLGFVEDRDDVPAAWEALECFRSWLYSGVYQNHQIYGNHIHAYWLAEQLHSSNFANAVMKKILQEMPARKYDEDLRDSYRHMWSNIKADSLLRKLFFDSAVFWKLEFGGGGKKAPESVYGEGVLGLNPETDLGLFLALKQYEKKFCGCQPRTKKQSRRETFKLLGNSNSRGICKCQNAPWDVEPNAYFIRDGC